MATCRPDFSSCYLNWVAGGGESGPNARFMEIEWAQELRRQCKEAGVPFFMKQRSQAGSPITVNGEEIKEMISRKHWFRELGFFPEDLRVREWPVVGQLPVAVAVPEPDNLSRSLFPVEEEAGHG